MKAKKSKRVTLDYSQTFQERLVRTLYQDPSWTTQFAIHHLDSDLLENNVHRWFAERIIGYAKRFLTGITMDALKIEARHAYSAGRLVRRRDRVVVNALLKKCRKPVPDRSYIKRELHRFIKTQVLKDVIEHDIIPAMKNNDTEHYDVALQKVLDIQAPTEGGLGHFMSQDRGERAKRRRDWSPDGIATGLDVDQYLKHGGPRKKQIAAVVAPPNVGKTTVLCHLAKQAVMLANKRVLLISLEEDDLTIQDRLDSAFTGISINEIEKEKNVKKIRRFWRRFAANHDSEMIVVKEMPMGVTTVSQIERYIKSLERKGFYPDVVIVDYAGLIKVEGKTRKEESRYEDFGTVYVDLRSMAQRLNVLVWTAHQGNRASMGKKLVTMKDLADSFKPAMHSDLLLAICATDQERLRSRARMYSMKVRGGRANMEFPIRLDYERVRVTNTAAASKVA